MKRTASTKRRIGTTASAREHPVLKVYGVIKLGRSIDSLALLDQMRGPRTGGRRARKKTKPPTP